MSTISTTAVTGQHLVTPNTNIPAALTSSTTTTSGPTTLGEDSLRHLNIFYSIQIILLNLGQVPATLRASHNHIDSGIFLMCAGFKLFQLKFD